MDKTNNQKYKLFFLPAYIVSEILWVIFSRKYQDISANSIDLMICYGLMVSTFGFIFCDKKKLNLKSVLFVCMTMSLFFVEHLIYLKKQSQLKSVYVTVFQQPRLIFLFLVSKFYFKDTFSKSEVVGLIGIVISLLGFVTAKNEDKHFTGTNDSFFKTSLMLICAAFIGGMACSSFEVFVKPLKYDVFNYFFVSHLVYIFYGVSFRFVENNFQLSNSAVYKDKRFYFLVILQALHAISTIMLSYGYKMVPRFMFMVATKVTSDLVCVLVNKIVLEWYGYFFYFICIGSVVLYKYKHIKEYFEK